MVDVRTCVYFSVLLLCFQITFAKPFFWDFCDWFCDDYDDVSTTTTSSDEDFWCDGCGTRRPRRPTTPMPTVPTIPVSYVVMGPQGFNFSMVPNGGSVLFNFLSSATPAPVPAAPAPAAPAPAPAPAASAPAPAVAAPAAAPAAPAAPAAAAAAPAAPAAAPAAPAAAPAAAK